VGGNCGWRNRASPRLDSEHGGEPNFWYLEDCSVKAFKGTATRHVPVRYFTNTLRLRQRGHVESLLYDCREDHYEPEVLGKGSSRDASRGSGAV